MLTPHHPDTQEPCSRLAYTGFAATDPTMTSFSAFSDSFPGVHYQDGSQFAFQFSQQRDEMSMDLDQDWTSNVDPQLRNDDLTVSMKQWSEQPLQRFLGEPQKPLFTAQVPYPSQHYESFHQDFNRPHSGPAPHPYAYNRQICSPAPSSQERYSICSSALSPNSADEWSNQQSEVYQIQDSFDSSPLSRSTSHNSQGVPDLIWPAKSFPHHLDQVDGGVSLSQLQGIPDQGAIDYQEDEGYMGNVDLENVVKSEMTTDHTHGIRISSIKRETPLTYHHQSIDEGIGHSLKDEPSPSRRSSYQAVSMDMDADEDMDAEAEIDDEIPPPEVIEVEEDNDDDEYKPRGTTTTSTRRRRRTTNNKSSPITSPVHTKRSKITKSTPSTSTSNNNTSKMQRNLSPFQCPSCSKNAFANATALQKHISSVHTRAFICAFSFAGCESRFASKNEWKRHVGSQHLCLNYWRCDVGACGKSSSASSSSSTNSSASQYEHQGSGSGNSTKTNEFNRKDLFTQHLRRMHAPFAVKRQGKKVESWEDRVRELQSSALRVRREAPRRTGCPVGGCGEVFEGKGGWDERMEHVGKHLEKVANGSAGGGGSGPSKMDIRIHQEIAEGVDGELLEWCLSEGIVEGRVGGGWRLCGSERIVVARREQQRGNDEDVDAEGEDDV